MFHDDIVVESFFRSRPKIIENAKQIPNSNNKTTKKHCIQNVN